MQTDGIEAVKADSADAVKADNAEAVRADSAGAVKADNAEDMDADSMKAVKADNGAESRGTPDFQSLYHQGSRLLLKQGLERRKTTGH